MVRTLRSLALTALALAVAVPASATVYTIHLQNGTTFETRYQPEDAPWDANKIVFTNEWGNLMALPRDLIVRIESAVEASGFGHQLDTTTVALGWAPNDAPADGRAVAERMAAQATANADAGATAGDEPIYDVNESPPTLPIYPVYPAAPEDATVVLTAPLPSSLPVDTGEPPY